MSFDIDVDPFVFEPLLVLPAVSAPVDDPVVLPELVVVPRVELVLPVGPERTIPPGVVEPVAESLIVPLDDGVPLLVVPALLPLGLRPLSAAPVPALVPAAPVPEVPVPDVPVPDVPVPAAPVPAAPVPAAPVPA
ncbi:MAG: hypothetical protein M3Z15_00430, partial [Pseudomonadota bacterium]|nr:hypothetical protein [Pseudomonadota bacterium]